METTRKQIEDHLKKWDPYLKEGSTFGWIDYQPKEEVYSIGLDFDGISENLFAAFCAFTHQMSQSSDKDIHLVINKINSQMKVGNFEYVSNSTFVFRNSMDLSLPGELSIKVRNTVLPCVAAIDHWILRLKQALI